MSERAGSCSEARTQKPDVAGRVTAIGLGHNGHPQTAVTRQSHAQVAQVTPSVRQTLMSEPPMWSAEQ